MLRTKLLQITLILCLINTISSCSMLDNSGGSSPTCRELKKQMLLNKSTSDRTSALQQQAESGGLARDYSKEGC